MILFKYPTRSRPALFRRTLTRYVELLSGKHDCRFVVSTDADDATMTAYSLEWIGDIGRAANVTGKRVWIEIWQNPRPQTKLSAINANMDGQAFDLLIVASDDMIPQAAGYDDRIVTLFRQHFPDGDGVLHTDDGRAGEALNTLPIIDAAYYARDGYIYRDSLAHPGDGYVSTWCDNEADELSRIRGRRAWVPEIIFRHEWTDATGADDLHRRNESFYEADMAVYQRRKAAGFPK